MQGKNSAWYDPNWDFFLFSGIQNIHTNSAYTQIGADTRGRRSLLIISPKEQNWGGAEASFYFIFSLQFFSCLGVFYFVLFSFGVFFTLSIHLFIVERIQFQKMFKALHKWKTAINILPKFNSHGQVSPQVMQTKGLK